MGEGEQDMTQAVENGVCAVANGREGISCTSGRWLVTLGSNPGSKPGLSLTPNLPQDKQYKAEKNILGSFGNTCVTARMAKAAAERWGEAGEVAPACPSCRKYSC